MGGRSKPVAGHDPKKLRRVAKRVSRDEKAANDRPKRGRGRPRVFEDEAKKQALLDQLCNHGRICLACFRVGVGVQTVADERARDPEFDEAVKLAVIVSRERIVESLHASALKGDTGAGIWLTKNLMPEEFRDRRETTVSNPDGSPLLPPRIVVEYVGGEADESAE
jgi:hypothetical protein